MKTAKKLENVTRRFSRPEQQVCPECQRRVRRAVTLSERTVITLQEIVKVIHAGYRCPDQTCSAHRRTYRSSRADALALPGFTFGLAVVLLMGQLQLGNHLVSRVWNVPAVGEHGLFLRAVEFSISSLTTNAK